MLKINFSLFIWLKQYRTFIGAILLAIAITACENSGKSQQSSSNSPVVSNLSDTSNSASPSVSPTPNAGDTKSLEQQAVQVIHDYYDAIARQDYKQAYLAWDGDGSASKQSFEEFQQGFANTASVAEEVGKPVNLEGAAGSLYIEVPVTVTAVTTNGTPQRFRGSQDLRNW
ncbi:MAG: hypothetical protein KAF91_29010, partial [Nostoc sp. TH1S01]|nr:hypothetical protein [Nostoc sp. TH1S01]